MNGLPACLLIQKTSYRHAGPRASASPDVLQTLQTVKQLLLTAKERQTQLERREAELTKEAKQVYKQVDQIAAIQTSEQHHAQSSLCSLCCDGTQ